MSKFIIMLATWNDMDWLKPCLEQIEYWNPTHLFLSEGCWDPKFAARSTDGTREYLEKWAKDKPNVWILDNIREAGYRTNQANQCKLVTRLADAKPGDWFMYQAVDFYLYKSDIDLYKKYMAENAFDYPRFEIRNFWQCTTLYSPKMTNQALNLPWRLINGFYWRPTCHLWVDCKPYHESPHPRQKTLQIKGYHYEGFRDAERLKDKYAVGDRQSPTVWKGGSKLKNRERYEGLHPQFVRETLERKVRKWSDGS